MLHRFGIPFRIFEQTPELRPIGYGLTLQKDALDTVGLADTMRWTRQSVRHYDGKVVPGRDPMGREHFWFTVVPIEAIEEGTDRWAVEHGFVSVTPLRLDLTDHAALPAAQESSPAQ